MDLEKNVQWLRDCAEIERLAYLYGRGVDSRQIDELKIFDECLLPDVEVIYEFGTWRGLDAHKKMVSDTMMRAYSFSHHLITNPLITVTGDTAVGSYRCRAARGIKTPQGQTVSFGGSTYVQDCVRTPAGWRIRRHLCEKSWSDDGGAMMTRVADELRLSAP